MSYSLPTPSFDLGGDGFDFWAGHMVRMKDSRWTTRSTEWQVKAVRSFGRTKRGWRDDIVGQQGTVCTRIAKDRERWRTLAEGYFLQWKTA